jgi:hypothetical protein
VSNVFKSGCLICGAELLYTLAESEMTCAVCRKQTRSNAVCRSGHFVCDRCHEADAFEYIETYCLNTVDTDPVAIAVSVMSNPRVALHGPEHHFLVPAALAAAYSHARREERLLPERLEKIKSRARNVLGGFCGFYGACGAAIGTGIFASVLQAATPLSRGEWRFANLMTARSLEKIAEAGGPRCCKRDTFLALETAARFMKEHFDTDIPVRRPACPFHDLNRECRRSACPYFPG